MDIYDASRYKLVVSISLGTKILLQQLSIALCPGKDQCILLLFP